MSNPLLEIQQYGQSAWLDYIHRDDLENGDLQRRIDEEGVLGVTSNPSIFQKAIGDSDTYDDDIMTLLDLEAQDIYEALAIKDIQNATDLFRPIYERAAGGDGYVSLEVSPLLARDTQGTIDEAKRLFETVGRPNLMIKIPATPEGIPAIEDTIAAGINVNVTLIFAINNYERVAEAFIRGLERRQAAGEDVTRVASVASFFLSRIDAMVDQILENNIRAAQLRQDTARIAANRVLLGQTAIANAKMAYKSFQRIFQGERFESLRRPARWRSVRFGHPPAPRTPPILIRFTSTISLVRIRSTPCRRPPWPPSRITAPSLKRSRKRPVNCCRQKRRWIGWRKSALTWGRSRRACKRMALTPSSTASRPDLASGGKAHASAQRYHRAHQAGAGHISQRGGRGDCRLGRRVRQSAPLE